MKTRLLLTFSFLMFAIYVSNAQVPKGFSYQAIARDGDGEIIAGQSLPVRIALHAGSPTGTLLWQEEHMSVTSNQFGLISLVVGTGNRTGGLTNFSDINWNAQTVYIKTTIRLNMVWTEMGSAPVWSVPYSLLSERANDVNSLKKLSVVSDNDLGSDALFEVKRKDGQTVFAVYPDSVNVFVPRSEGKASKGGFAVGGFGASKAAPERYFWVSPDSVRIYIDPTPPESKGSKGGFAVGGFGESKGINDMYFNLTGASNVNTVDASPQILWYPNKNAFLAGNVHIGHVDSVGDYSTALGYQSIAMGDYSQAFGYRAKAFGDYSTSIGRNSIAGSSTPATRNAFAFGWGTKATGEDSYALGSGAIASGYRSFAFGSVGLNDSGESTSTPTTASGSYSVAIGMGAQATQKGGMALGIGALASGYNSSSLGYYSTASNYYASAIGRSASANGHSSIAVGYGAQTDSKATDASAFGKNAKAFAPFSVSVGSGATTQEAASYSTALGYGAVTGGQYATALGYNVQANGAKAISIGSYYDYTYFRLVWNPAMRKFEITPVYVTKNNIANGDYSIALGNGNTVNNGGFAMGSNNTASKMGSVALGHTNSADSAYAFAAGSNNYARGYNAFALGESVIAEAANSFVIGYNNIINASYDRDEWIDTDPLFVIGNGGSGARSDAMVVLKNGNTNINGILTANGFDAATINPTSNTNLTIDAGTLHIDAVNNRVGINNTTPQYSFDLTGTMNVTGTGRFGGDVSLSSASPGFYLYDSDLNADDFRFEANNDALSIWSQGKLSYLLFNVSSAGIIRMPYVYNNIVGASYRDLFIDNNGYLGYLSSSSRYKTDVEDIDEINWLYNLRPVTFNYKNSTSDQKQYGLIAEEVLEVNPGFVSFNSDNEPETVTYSALITPLLKAVQDQKKTIETLKADNDSLKSRLEKLEAIVTVLSENK